MELLRGTDSLGGFDRTGQPQGEASCITRGAASGIAPALLTGPATTASCGRQVHHSERRQCDSRGGQVQRPKSSSGKGLERGEIGGADPRKKDVWKPSQGNKPNPGRIKRIADGKRSAGDQGGFVTEWLARTCSRRTRESEMPSGNPCRRTGWHASDLTSPGEDADGPSRSGPSRRCGAMPSVRKAKDYGAAGVGRPTFFPLLSAIVRGFARQMVKKSWYVVSAATGAPSR